MEERESIYQVKPSFNFIYEMFMPTGRKIKYTLVILILVIICYFFINIALSSDKIDMELIQKSSVDIYNIFNNVSIVIIAVLALKLIVHLVIQMWQYSSIKYTFYDDYLEYEDSFLNQHKKTLRYDNIKEIEIRRTIWDRINGYGIIVIYTNAEKSSSNGLILYSIKDPLKTYNKIDEIIHDKYSVAKVDNVNVQEISPISEESKIEDSFKDSLNNKE
jgi:uncharacterized membrane protein YdbT with pleckstrin-like domain